MRAILIDRQAAARLDLRVQLMAHPAVVVVAEAASLPAARELLVRGDYDLVFLEVQLGNDSGFDLIPDVRPGARVVFVTTHAGFALRAFEVRALDYLLKPVKPSRLADTLDRLPATPPGPSETGVKPRLTDTVRLESGKFSRFVFVGDVSAIDAQQNYSRVQLTDGSRVMVRRALKEWVALLPACFVRVHRGTLVNLERVTGFARVPRTLALHVAGLSDPVAVSRQATPQLKAQLSTRFPDI